MIDADGHGLVLTNATFVANIKKGVIQNYTNAIPKNATSSVYVTSKGVFLDLHKKISVYRLIYIPLQEIKNYTGLWIFL